MGVRASYEEAYTNEHRATLINGIFNAEFGEKTEVVVLPDVTNCELEICGEKFTMLSGKVEEFKTSLDMKTGEFKRSLKWTSPMGKCIRLDFSRIVSDVRRHIMAQKVSVTPLNGDMEIKVLTGVNGKVTNMGVQHFTNPQKRAYSDGIKGLCVKTVQSNIDIAVHYNIKSNKACENKTVIDKRSVYTSSVYNLHNGETAVVEKISSYRNPEKVATIFESFGLSEILKMQVHKQADLLMLFYLMKDMFTDDEIRRNFEYYEKKTLHDSSLSMCIHALIAARLGMDEMADDMFYKACCVDLGDNTDNSDDGIHSASIGGIWLMLALGYAGLEISEEGLSISPVLPQGWSEYSFYLAYRGSKIKVKVDANGCILERISGNEVCVNVNGKEMIV